MKLSIKDTKGNSAGELDVKFEVIPNGRGTQAVHDTVVAYMAAQRQGNASTKTMGEVNGTGKKPWRQKGTGRARADPTGPRRPRRRRPVHRPAAWRRRVCRCGERAAAIR